MVAVSLELVEIGESGPAAVVLELRHPLTHDGDAPLDRGPLCLRQAVGDPKHPRALGDQLALGLERSMYPTASSYMGRSYRQSRTVKPGRLH